MSANPYVAQAGERSWHAGLGIVDSGASTVEALCSHNWVDAALSGVGLVLDAMAAASDPIGSALAAGIGWVIDHLNPIKGWFDEVAGNPEQVAAGAQTWSNIAAGTRTVAGDWASGFGSTMGTMEGEAVASYAGFADMHIRALEQLANAAAGMQNSVTVAAGLVGFVHGFLRDVLSQLVGAAISWVAEAVLSLGTLIPWICEQIATRIASIVGKCERYMTGLTRSGSKLRSLLSDLGQWSQKVKGILGKVDDGASSAGRNAPSTGGASPRGPDLPGSSAAREATGSPGSAARPTSEMPTCGDPVDVGTGHVFLEQTDIDLPGELPLLLARQHNSAYRLGRCFGPSWASVLDERIELDQQGAVLVREDGSRLMYAAFGDDGDELPLTGSARWPLRRLREDVFAVRDPLRNLTRVYRVLGRPEEAHLVEIRDRAGRWIRFDRTTSGLPVAVRHHGGYHVQVLTRHGRVTAYLLRGAQSSGAQSTAPQEIRLTSFDYTGGHLTGVVNSSGLPLRFAYDDQGRMLSWADRIGARYEYHYDEQHRCVAQSAPDGTMRYLYDYGAHDDESGRRVTVATDSLGYEQRFLVDGDGHLVAHVDQLGHVTEHAYDETGQRIATTHADGAVSRWEFDRYGRMTRQELPGGVVSEMAYDTAGWPVRITAPDGTRSVQTFDGRGQVSSVTGPDGLVTRYTYDQLGNLSTVTDPLGGLSQFRCDAAGLVTASVDPMGAVTHYARDVFGRVHTVTDPLGAVTTLAWSVEGRLVERTNADGTTERWDYDGEGNLLARTDGAGRVTRWDYGAFDVVTSQTHADGTQLRYHYDTELRLVRVVNEGGSTWAFERDAAGRVLEERDYDGRTLRFERDALGRVITRTNAAGQTVHTAYDSRGHVARTSADGQQTSYEYDVMGRLLRAAGPEVVLERSLDAAGRPTAETVDGRTATWSYDPLGRVTARTTPSGAQSTWRYDLAGRPTGLELGGSALAMSYDAGGREVESRIGSSTVRSAWDVMGRLTRRTQDQSEGLDLAYAYSPGGELVTEQSSRGGRRHYSHDPRGRVVAVAAGAAQERFAYDAVGNLTQATAVLGDSQAPDAGGRDYQGSLLTRAGRDRFRYDPAGRLVERRRELLSGGAQVWTFEWDAHDRMTTATTPQGHRWVYRYDPLGRRIAKEQTAGGATLARVLFTWDGARLAEQTEELVGVPGSRRTTTWEHRAWTPLAQLTTSDQAPARESVDAAFAAIVTDLTGMPLQLVGPDGESRWEAKRYVWGARTSDASAQPLRLPGQYDDAETGLYYNLHRYYDPANARYISPDPLGLEPGPNDRAYVSDPFTEIDPLGLAPCTPHTAGTQGPQGGRGSSSSGDIVPYDADFALGQMAGQGRATSSQLDDFGSSQGWTRSQTPSGPIKYTDGNGVVRITIKEGSPRAPGSGGPHVEIRNAAGARVDPYGFPVTRRSPGNHTPITWDH